MRPLPVSASLVLLACGALAVPAAASAAGTLKVPVPAGGQVAVSAATVSGAGKLVAPKRLPAGTVVTGGIAGSGAKRVALVAVIRPDGTQGGAKSLRIALRGRGRLTAAGASAGVFGAAPPAGLAGAAKPACAKA